MTQTPSLQNVRLTITVTPEVHEVFKRFSAAAGMSLSRAMGEWLGDTVEAAEYTAGQMERARAAPKAVMREMHAYALGLADETGALMRTIKTKGEASRQPKAEGSASGSPPLPKGKRKTTLSPPLSNTGGKASKSTTKSMFGDV